MEDEMTTTVTVAGRAWQLILEAASKIVKYPNTMTPLAGLDQTELINLLGAIHNLVDPEGRHDVIWPDDIMDHQLFSTLGSLVPIVKAALS